MMFVKSSIFKLYCQTAYRLHVLKSGRVTDISTCNANKIVAPVSKMESKPWTYALSCNSLVRYRQELNYLD